MISIRILIAVLISFPLASSCTKDPFPNQDSIIEHTQLDNISDATYYFPANKLEEDATVYLPLRRWDIIFTGKIKPDPNRPEFGIVDSLIPGYFNHMLVYIGKDRDGYAYVVDINIETLKVEGGDIKVDGGVRLLAISKDYGEAPHPSGKHVIDRNHYLVRWAKTFNEATRTSLLQNDDALTSAIKTHIVKEFPYQLEFAVDTSPLALFDRKIELVDDGLDGGAGCGDYWTALFEKYASVCMTGVRMNAGELVHYYTLDSVGKESFLPPDWNPFGDETLYLSDLLESGYSIQEDAPHVFSCDSTQESGVVLPNKVYDNPLLEDIIFN